MSFAVLLKEAASLNPDPTTPASSPPTTQFPIHLLFQATQPLGPLVSIHPETGLISGTAPDIIGEFVICVCVKEYRNGLAWNNQERITHKDRRLHLCNCRIQDQPLVMALH